MKSLNFNFTTDLDFGFFGELPCKIYVEGFTFERPAPPASHPDAPGYDDCGDPGEIDDFKIHHIYSVLEYDKKVNAAVRVTKEVELSVPFYRAIDIDFDEFYEMCLKEALKINGD